MTDILSEIIAHKRIEIELQKQAVSLERLQEEVAALNYYVKQAQFHVFGVTTIIIALITYCIAPIVATQPSWFYVMVIVPVR